MYWIRKMFVGKYKRYLLFCTIVPVVIMVLSYLFGNIAYPLKLDTQKYALFEYFGRGWFNAGEDLNDAVFVNVSYDKMLIVDTCDLPDTNRKAVITDRGTLLQFLKKVEGLNYRYLFLDIMFDEKSGHSEYDSALVAQLLSMRDVAIIKHWDIGGGKADPMIDSRLDSIAYFCDFDELRTNAGFFNYKYLQYGEPSIALAMYNKMTERGIKRFGPLYFDGCKLCHNVLFLTIHTSMEYDAGEGGSHFYWDMGPNLLYDSIYFWEDFSDTVNGRYLIVGDMKNDMHDTYAHKQPGAYLHYLGFLSLMKGNHIVRWWSLLLLLTYALISFIILQGLSREETRWRLLRWIEARPLLHFTCTLLGYGFCLFLLSALFYFCFDIAYNIFIPSFSFALLSNYVQFKKSKRK